MIEFSYFTIIIRIYDCKPLLNFGIFKELQTVNYFN